MVTKTEKLIFALKQHRPGTIEIQSNSRKYRTFQTMDGKLYFVGKAASLRTGRTSSTSVSLENIVDNLIAKYPYPV